MRLSCARHALGEKRVLTLVLGPDLSWILLTGITPLTLWLTCLIVVHNQHRLPGKNTRRARPPSRKPASATANPQAPAPPRPPAQTRQPEPAGTKLQSGTGDWVQVAVHQAGRHDGAAQVHDRSGPSRLRGTRPVAWLSSPAKTAACAAVPCGAPVDDLVKQGLQRGSAVVDP